MSLKEVRVKKRKSHAGRKAFDVVLMFKVLVLQHLYNVSDDEVEYPMRDRYSFCRFLGLTPEGRIPDSKTMGLFREDLVKADLMKTLFFDFDAQLDSQGYKARKGQIVDVSFVDVPRQRNKKEENDLIKAGNTPDRILENPNVGAQKDTDARWAKKNDEKHFGYKNHASVDNENQLIRNYEVTSAEVHDSQVFLKILTANSSKKVWVGSAYRSEFNEISLAASNLKSQVHEKGKRGQPLSDEQKQSNTRKSRTRAWVEHVFGSITNEQGGLFNRVIGLPRNALKVGMMNIVYNMRRLVTLQRLSVS